jgi:pimeloyl-ACP methyl ester carboxylesterase
MAAAPLARRRVATNGIELAYVEQGEGEPLVLIMGLGADADAWQPHLEEYRRHFRCFAVDNRGAGESSAPVGPYSTGDFADDYAGLIRALSLGPVRVVGISMGGAIAQELALRHRDLVERLVIVASWARCDAYTAEVFRSFAAVRAAVPPAEFTRLLQLWIWSPGYLSDHLDELREAREAQPAAPMAQHAFEAQCAACVAHDTLERLQAIRAPTLVTAGEADIFTPLRLAEELRAAIPGAELEVFPAAGHAHHWESLDLFNSLSSRWLSS